jgi:hypothetical protein
VSGELDEFLELIGELTRADVEFVVIGALAVNYHGVVRGTEDVDIVPDPDPSNLVRLRSALERLEAHVPGADPSFDPLSRQSLEVGAAVECLTRLGPLHIVQGQSGIPGYTELRARSHRVEIDGIRFRVCSFEHLVEMKRAAGRPQDQADLADLERARRLESGGEISGTAGSEG